MSFFSASDLQRQAMNLHHGESIAQISEKSRLLRVTNAFAVQKWEPETMANRDDEFNCGRGWVRRASAYQPSRSESIKHIESTSRLLRGTNASVLRQNEAEDAMLMAEERRRSSYKPGSESPPRGTLGEPLRRRSITRDSLGGSPPRALGSSKEEDSVPKEEEENVFAAFAKMSVGGLRTRDSSSSSSPQRTSPSKPIAAEVEQEEDDGSTMSAFAAFARRPSLRANIVSDVNAFHNR